MPKDLTDESTFTEPIVVPVDADPRNAESVEVPFQGLANRTRQLADRADDFDAETQRLAAQIGGPDGTDEWVYEDGPRVRTVQFSIADGFVADNGTNGPGWITGVAYDLLRSQYNRGRWVFSLTGHLPDTAVTRIRALVKPGAERSADMRMEVRLSWRTANFDTPSYGDTIIADEEEDDGSTDLQSIVITQFHSLDRATTLDWVTVTAGVDSGDHNGDRLFALEIQFNDYGPRNY